MTETTTSPDPKEQTSIAKTDDDEQETWEDDDFLAENHTTQIPYFMILIIIFVTLSSYLATHFILEDRYFILLHGSSSRYPYYLPGWIKALNPTDWPIKNSSHLKPTLTATTTTTQPLFPGSIIIYHILRFIFYFTPFSLHPLQWITFSFIAIVFLISFAKVRLTDPGDVSKLPIWNFSTLPVGIQQKLMHRTTQYAEGRLSIFPTTYERKHDGTYRYCNKTGSYKPDRAHFDHATGRLISRFDHYCIFLYSSIGYHNHKYFILFLLYLCALAFFIGIKVIFALYFLSDIVNTTHFVTNLLLGCLGIAVCFAIGGFLGFHIYLISKSLTTLEFNEKYNKIDPNTGVYKATPFDCGLYENFVQIFGRGPFWTWFLPTSPVRLPHEQDGTFFLVNTPHKGTF